MAESVSYDRLFKLVIIGNSGVGKSCLLLRFADDVFREEELSTIGVDFKIKSLQIDGKTVKLQIWDTAGQERFSTITSSYYKGSHGILVVYDVTSEQSFQNVENWMRCINDFAPKGVPKLLVANKVDLEDHRKVSSESGERLAQTYQCPYIETSARNPEIAAVDRVFVQIAQMANDSLEGAGTLTAGELSMRSIDLNRQSSSKSKKRGCSCR